MKSLCIFKYVYVTFTVLLKHPVCPEQNLKCVLGKD